MSVFIVPTDLLDFVVDLIAAISFYTWIIVNLITQP